MRIFISIKSSNILPFIIIYFTIILPFKYNYHVTSPPKNNPHEKGGRNFWKLGNQFLTYSLFMLPKFVATFFSAKIIFYLYNKRTTYVVVLLQAFSSGWLKYIFIWYIYVYLKHMIFFLSFEFLCFYYEANINKQ